MELSAETVEFAKKNAIRSQTVETYSAIAVKTSDIPELVGFAYPYAVIHAGQKGGTAYTASTEAEALDTMEEMLYHINEMLYC